MDEMWSNYISEKQALNRNGTFEGSRLSTYLFHPMIQRFLANPVSSVIFLTISWCSAGHQLRGGLALGFLVCGHFIVHSVVLHLFSYEFVVALKCIEK